MLDFILGFEILLSMIIFWKYDIFQEMLACEDSMDWFVVFVKFLYLLLKVNVILFLLGLSFYLMIKGIKQ